MVDVTNYCLFYRILVSHGYLVLNCLFVGYFEGAVLANFVGVAELKFLLMQNEVLHEFHLLLAEQFAVACALLLILALREDRLQLRAHQILGTEIFLALLGVILPLDSLMRHFFYVLAHLAVTSFVQ